MKMKIRDICNSVTDGSHNPPQGIEKSEYMMLSSKNVFDDEITFEEPRYLTEEDFEREHKRTKISTGDVLLTIVGTVGRTAVVDEDMPSFALQRSVAVLHPKKDVCSARFLMYALRGKRSYIENRAKGVAQKGIYLGEVSDIDIQIPEAIEQDTIVEKLDRINNVIKQRQQELQLLDNLIKARFVELFGVPIDNTKNWLMDKAENLCTLVTDGSHFSPKACDEGYPMLSVKDMRQNGFDYSDCKLVDDETFEILKKQGCVPQVNDVLIAKDGSYFTRAFAITEYKDQAILSSIGMYRPDIDKILPRFLASYLMMSEVIEFVNRGYVTGTALRRVIIKGLKNIPVYIPPLELQKEFVQFAEQVDKSKVVA